MHLPSERKWKQLEKTFRTSYLCVQPPVPPHSAFLPIIEELCRFSPGPILTFGLQTLAVHLHSPTKRKLSSKSPITFSLLNPMAHHWSSLYLTSASELVDYFPLFDVISSVTFQDRTLLVFSIPHLTIHLLLLVPHLPSLSFY